MKIKPQAREKLGFLLSIGLACWALISALAYQNTIEDLQQWFRSGIQISQSIARYEEKLTCLQDDLSPEATVGFVTLLPPDLASEYYQLTQYALVPVLVEFSTENSLIVGYVPNPSDIQTILSDHPSYRITKECGNEIVLFERTP
jgi:hypothetical protein